MTISRNNPMARLAVKSTITRLAARATRPVFVWVGATFT
jgi:hypothetical protein